MVTLSSSPGGQPHQHREIAESFGAEAEAYDRARPHYPQALAEAIVPSFRGRRVLDVGIGTGISALPFRAAGCDVLGVEADERMARLARSRGFDVEVARFEEWEDAGRRFDGLISGQTWHWVDPRAGAVKAAEVLRPGGRIALFWNAGDPPPELATRFGEVYRSVDTGLPFAPWAGGRAVDGYARILDSAVRTEIDATAAFGPVEELRVEWTARVTTAEWLRQVPTAGGHNRLPRPALDALLTGMAQAIDDFGGAFTMEYTTLGLIATRVA